MGRLKHSASVVAIAVALALLVAGCSLGTTKMNPPTTAPVAVVGSTAPAKSAATASATTDSAAASHKIVQITSKGFSPSTVTVKAGTRVVWNNDNTALRNLDFGGGLKSGVIKLGQSASHVFGTPGTFPYFDSLNTTLKGVVIVQ